MGEMDLAYFQQNIKYVILVQSVVRRHLARKHYLNLKKFIIKMQAITRAWLAGKKLLIQARMHAKRTRVFLEIANIEKTYVNDLKCVVHDFKHPLVNEHIITAGEAKQIFNNIETIYKIHESINNQLQSMRKTWSYKSSIASCFMEEGRDLEAYREYIPHADEAMETLHNLKAHNPKLHKFLLGMEGSPKMRNMELQDMLIQPVQRVPRYILLLKEYHKFTPPNHPDAKLVPRLIQDLDNILKEINQRRRRSINDSKTRFLHEEVSGVHLTGLTDYEMEGELLRVFEDGEQKKVYVFLFDEMFIMAKHATPEKSDSPIIASIVTSIAKILHAKTYQFKLRRSIKMTRVVEVKPDDHDGKVFRLMVSKKKLKKGEGLEHHHYTEKECKIYCFRAPSEKVQMSWINVISKLVKQFQEGNNNRPRRKSLKRLHSV